MKVLIACEFSGVVRTAFEKLGYDVTSCDILPSDIPGKHYQGNVEDVLNQGFDLMIAFPPCTHLATSGAKHFKYKQKEQKEALEFVKLLLDADIKHIALENPVSVISTKIRKPNQIVHPWMFGDAYKKRTCLWLKNLPLLEATDIVEPEPDIYYASGKHLPAWYNTAKNFNPKKRRKIRSTTFQGFADAMAMQWGLYVEQQLKQV